MRSKSRKVDESINRIQDLFTQTTASLSPELKNECLRSTRHDCEFHPPLYLGVRFRIQNNSPPPYNPSL